MQDTELPLDALLEARGTSKRWLAKKLHMDETLLNRYLYGRRTPPTDLYARIADILHVPASFITPSAQAPAA